MEDGARRPSSYYDITCFNSPFPQITVLQTIVGRWSPCPVLQHPFSSTPPPASGINQEPYGLFRSLINFFLRNDELEIMGIFIHLPFLPLKRKYEKNHIVMYRYCPVTRKNHPITFLEKEYLKNLTIFNLVFEVVLLSIMSNFTQPTE